MYAVIESGGKQYRVQLGAEIQVDHLEVGAGDSITFDRVLLVADGDSAAVGQPHVAGALVSADVVSQDRGDKIVVFKYRPKARRRVKKGFRAALTTLRISDIAYDGQSAATLAAREAEEREQAERAARQAAAERAAADQALAARLAADMATSAADEGVGPEPAPGTRVRHPRGAAASPGTEPATSTEPAASSHPATSAEPAATGDVHQDDDASAPTDEQVSATTPDAGSTGTSADEDEDDGETPSSVTGKDT